MTDTLREEIYTILDYYFYMDGRDRETTKTKTIPEILTKFEKRIDSMIYNEEHRLDDSGIVEITVDCYNEIFLRDHVLEKLNEIKQEILK